MESNATPCRTVPERLQNDRTGMNIFISPQTRNWLTLQFGHIMMDAGNTGRSTIVRAILNAFRKEGVDFAGCHSEFDICEKVRAMIRSASEVKR